jgi:hypothetical protein
MVTKNELGQIDGNGWILVWDCGDRWQFAVFVLKDFSVSACFSLIGDVLMKMQSGDKMFLSALTPPIYWHI